MGSRRRVRLLQWASRGEGSLRLQYAQSSNSAEGAVGIQPGPGGDRLYGQGRVDSEDVWILNYPESEEGQAASTLGGSQGHHCLLGGSDLGLESTEENLPRKR